jgi:hypothetical protein
MTRSVLRTLDTGCRRAQWRRSKISVAARIARIALPAFSAMRGRAGRVAFGNFRVGEIPLSIVRTGELLTVLHFGIFPKEQRASYRMCRQDGCGSATIVA